MSEFTPLREAVDTLASRSPSPDFGELKRRATRRGRRRVAMAAAATAAVIAGSVVAVTGLDDDRRTGPVEQPKSVEGAGPVWYDANGLHRGDVVEQTPVELGEPNVPAAGMFNYPTMTGGLALVRSGAVYLDPATGDVWFHPWGGKPRIVGQRLTWGPRRGSERRHRRLVRGIRFQRRERCPWRARRLRHGRRPRDLAILAGAGLWPPGGSEIPPGLR